jgi:hypothetical protein
MPAGVRRGAPGRRGEPKPAMGTQTLRARLRRVEELRATSDPDALLAGLQRDLGDASNHVVAKAAAIAGSRYVPAAIPDLLAAYERLFIGPEVDPLALGKLAIAQALKELDFRDPAPFVEGLAYFEPVGIRKDDRAADLRITCAHALVACDLDGRKRLELLIDHLVDPDRTVRREVVRAVAQVGGMESVLLLRFKALAGDADPEVYGECFRALLELDARESVAFVEKFLTARNADVAIEAAGALAGSRVAGALDVVVRLWMGGIPAELRRAIVFSCAASPLAAASEFLLSIVAERQSDFAIWALSALASSRFRGDVKDRARDAAHKRDDAGVMAAYAREFELG